MRKIIVALLFSFIINCKDNSISSIIQLSMEKGVEFKNLKFEKIFDFIHYKPKWCVPFQDRVICKVAVDMNESSYIFFIYDYNKRLIKEKKIKGGIAPDETAASLSSMIISAEENKIIYVDANDYIKSLDINTLEIQTIGKVSNIVKGYRSKFRIGGWGSPERNGKTVITTFESSSFEEDFEYYFVKFNNLFKDFRIIYKSKKPKLINVEKGLKKRIIFKIDYYAFLKKSPLFTVDWKRNFIYYIPDIERPFLEALDFRGKNRKRFELVGIDSKKFKIEKRTLDLYYDYLESIPDPFKELVQEIRVYPPQPPPLQGIKVIGDWLLIITGKRDWQKGENEAIVYRLPSFKYEGSFFIPFPNNFLKPIFWINDHYLKTDLVEVDEGYYFNTTVYRVNIK